MDEEKAFIVKFKKAPKAFKKFVKENYTVQKQYEAEEANVIYTDAIRNGNVSGKMIVIVRCLASNRIVCNVEINIDQQLTLDVALMNVVSKGMKEKNRTQEEINVLLEDFKVAFGWEEYHNLRKRLTRNSENKETVKSEKVEKELTNEIDETNEADEIDEIDETDEDYETIQIDEVEDEIDFGFEIDEQLKEQKNVHLEDEKTSNELLDVSTLGSIAKLETKVKEHNQNFKKPLAYLTDVFELQGELDFVAGKKKGYIENNCISPTASFFKELYDYYNDELTKMKKHAKSRLDIEYREVQSENYIKIEEQMKVIEEIKAKKFEEKKDIEVEKIEKAIKEEMEQEIAIKRSEIEKILFADLNDEQKEQLVNCRESVESEVRANVQNLIDENNVKCQNFINGMRAKLQAKQFDFEREYNNLEIQKMRQEMFEEQKNFQQQMLEMQQMQNEMAQKNIISQVITNDDEEEEVKFPILWIVFAILLLIGGGFFFFRLDFVDGVIRGVLA